MTMTRTAAAAILVAALAISGGTHASAQTNLAGRWTLDRQASQFPREVGFGTDWAASGSEGGSTGGVPAGSTRGHRGKSSAGPFLGRPESEDDAKRLRLLTDDVRTPPARLTIVQNANAVTVTNERGQSRTFHADGRQELLQLDGSVPLATTAKWEGDRLVVLYEVEEGRQLRYTYGVTGNPQQLIVDVKFLERGGGDAVRRVYGPAGADEPAPPASPQTTPPPGTPAGAPTMPPAPGAPSQSAPAQAKPDLRPGAELKGLTKLGLVVEGIGSQATACGLNQDSLETAITKRLTDGGLQVVRNADEDTYLYVNVMTGSVSAGLCVSRYDVTLYTHTTATLSYGAAPVLVEVQLLHKGGIAGGAKTAHAQSVVQGVTEAVDDFVKQIQQANGK